MSLPGLLPRSRARETASAITWPRSAPRCRSFCAAALAGQEGQLFQGALVGLVVRRLVLLQGVQTQEGALGDGLRELGQRRQTRAGGSTARLAAPSLRVAVAALALAWRRCSSSRPCDFSPRPTSRTRGAAIFAARAQQRRAVQRAPLKSPLLI